MSIFKFLLLFLAQKETSSNNLTDTCILHFKERCKFVATLHRILMIEEIVKEFACFLGTANLRNNSLLDKTISIACIISLKRLIFPNLL